MAQLLPSHTLHKKGVLNLGTTYETKKVAEALLLKDAKEHHCFHRAPSIHNHLPHHILAAYDLGAPPSLLQKIYDWQSKRQRPIALDEKDKTFVITRDNWLQYVGNANAYNGFVNFFAGEVQSLGVLQTVEHYIDLDASAKEGNMLLRFISGAFHPIIQLGYGIEFGDDMLVVTALAQTAIHPILPFGDLFSFVNPEKVTTNKPTDGIRQPSKGPSLLELMRQFYESPTLRIPYKADENVYELLRRAGADGRDEEIRRICSQYYIDEEAGEGEFDLKVEEFIWLATLMMYSTGREGKNPKLDFFLMHLSTTTIFFPTIIKFLKNPKHKANLLRAFLPIMMYIIVVRGTPAINPSLIMAYTRTPRPPFPLESHCLPDKTAIGNPLEDADYNAWPVLISSCVHAPDSHVLKSMRSLLFAAKNWGDVGPGGLIGAHKVSDTGETVKGEETIKGISKIDGTIFVRAGGILMNYMGWITHGQPAREDWDRSGLGWDEAWATEY